MKLYKREVWEATQPEDMGSNHCVLCEKHIHREYLIHETQHWFVIHNMYPMLGLREHIMACPKKHYILACDIPAEVMAEYPQVEKFVYEFYAGGSYFTFMRESPQNRSLEHVHYHFLPGKLNYKHLEHVLLQQGFTDKLASE